MVHAGPAYSHLAPVYPLSHEHQPPTSAAGWPRPEHTGAADVLREAGKSMSLAKKSWSTGRRRCQLGVSDRMCGVGWYAVKAQTVVCAMTANMCVIQHARANFSRRRVERRNSTASLARGWTSAC